MKDSKPKIAGYEPFITECEPGTYYWCTCGHSSTQPFCDGTHREKSELKSMKFEIEERSVAAFCMCKQTKTPPYCDGSHNSCPKED
jgi:CDGSH-type Zn-finger protein